MVTSSDTVRAGSSSPAPREPARRRGRLPTTAPSSITHRAPISVPAWIPAADPTLVPSPMTTPSWITAPGASDTSGGTRALGWTNAPARDDCQSSAPAPGLLKRQLKCLEHANDAQAADAVGAGALTGERAGHKVFALDP